MATAYDLPSDNVAVFRAGQRVRLCVAYIGQVRELLWLCVGKDASLYMAYCRKSDKPTMKLLPEELPDGGAIFQWDAAEVVEGPVRPKFSFHASGVTLSRSGRSIGVNLRLLTHRTLLCSFLPRHPNHWPVTAKRKQGDIIIHDLLGDECPLSIDLHYEPAGMVPGIRSDLQQGCFVLPVGYVGVNGIGRVLLHLVVTRQIRAGVWPPLWTVVLPTVGDVATPLTSERWIEPGAQGGRGCKLD